MRSCAVVRRSTDADDRLQCALDMGGVRALVRVSTAPVLDPGGFGSGSALMERHLGATRIAGPEACRDVLLVGEDNPISSDPQYALYHEPRGCAGNRLQSKVLGVDPRRTYLAMWRTNLCTGGWDLGEATERARILIAEDVPWNTVVLLGSKVARAYAKIVAPAAFTWQTMQCLPYPAITFVALPHPSGRNPIWNDPDTIVRARDLMRLVAPKIPWGEV
jgi:hypothetical protein